MKILFRWCFAVGLSVLQSWRFWLSFCSKVSSSWYSLTVSNFSPPLFKSVSLSFFLPSAALWVCFCHLRLSSSTSISLCCLAFFFCFVWSIRSSLLLLKIWAGKWNGNTPRVWPGTEWPLPYETTWVILSGSGQKNMLVTGFLHVQIWLILLLIRSFKCHPSQLNVEALFHHRNFLQALESYDVLRRTQRKQCFGQKLSDIFVEMQLNSKCINSFSSKTQCTLVQVIWILQLQITVSIAATF